MERTAVRLRKSSPVGLHSDEDALYRAAGHLDYSTPSRKPLGRRACHGTHVMDLACNPASAPGLGPIIAVQLPISVVADTSLAGLAPQVYDALLYMIDRADKIAAANGVKLHPAHVHKALRKMLGLDASSLTQLFPFSSTPDVAIFG